VPPPAPQFTYGDVSVFSLVWRWTQASHDVLTSTELASIRPLQPDSASAASDYARGLHKSAHEQVFQLTDTNQVKLLSWLTRLPVAPDERVVLSWDRTVAAEIRWQLLLSRWSAFWYPSSDDLEVFPLTGRWVLRISHDGRFEWTPVLVHRRVGE
jgi:hypothetical protein